jgi:hypothetical protein
MEILDGAKDAVERERNALERRSCQARAVEGRIQPEPCTPRGGVAGRASVAGHGAHEHGRRSLRGRVNLSLADDGQHRLDPLECE